MDVGLRPRAIPPPSEAIDVSILVLVDVGLRLVCPVCGNKDYIYVSILVLVDVGLRPGQDYTVTKRG